MNSARPQERWGRSTARIVLVEVTDAADARSVGGSAEGAREQVARLPEEAERVQAALAVAERVLKAAGEGFAGAVGGAGPGPVLGVGSGAGAGD